MAGDSAVWLDEVVQRVVDERRIGDLATVVGASDGAEALVGRKLLAERDGTWWGSLGVTDLDQRVAHDGAQALQERRSRIGSYVVALEPGAEATVEVFHEILEPQPQLLIVGAGHIAVPLAKFGSQLGFEVVVLDDREKYANRERFPDADQVLAADFGATLRDYPITEASYVVIITRAHTYDEEALRLILHKPTPYVGMIGSRRRVQTVLRTLAAEGYARERIAAIHAPIGLDIGAEMPEEIALAIIAEVVKVRRGGSGESLSRQGRPIDF
ncbi:MAG: xanthine dehydrogenase accessory factor [Chloroflexota bacterium]|nr:xanthine dehydrogenase accessory factor [Chloroflexota bacterium]